MIMFSKLRRLVRRGFRSAGFQRRVSPDFVDVMKIIASKAGKNNIPMGTHIVEPDAGLLDKRISEGYQFIAYCTDAIFLYKNSVCPRFNGKIINQ